MLGNLTFLAERCPEKAENRKVIILVADFEDETRSDLDSYRVTDTILNNLRSATAEYKDVEVKALNKTIAEKQGSDFAREEGKKHNAAIVIWGWYGKTPNTVPISVNFEILTKAKDLFEPEQKSKGEIQTASSAEFDNFTMQLELLGEINYLTLVTRGLSRYVAEDWYESIPQLTEALESAKPTILDPSLLYFYRGNAYYSEEEYNHAIADYSQALQLDPDNIRIHSKRSNAFINNQEYDQAIADLNRVLQLDLNNVLAYINRGKILIDNQEYNHAIADFDQALKLDPNNILAYSSRGLAFINNQEYNRAIADFNRVLQLNPNDVSAYNSRGNAYYLQKDYNRAITDYNKALELNPNLAEVYYNRGTTYIEKGDRKKGIQDLRRAFGLTDNPQLKQMLEEELLNLHR